MPESVDQSEDAPLEGHARWIPLRSLFDFLTNAQLDGRLTLEGPNGHWAVDVILKNLTDKIIIFGGAGGTSLPASNGSTLLQIDQPRNVAVQARYQW